MVHVKKHLDILGLKVKDRVTKFEGIAASVSFDLYGCVQVVVNPGIDSAGKLGEQCWFDIARLMVIDEMPVMGRPDFEFGVQAEGKQGAAEKPANVKM